MMAPRIVLIPAMVLVGLAFVLTTYLWPQARGGGVDVQAAFFLFLAFHLTMRTRERFGRLLRPRRVDLIGAGAALAISLPQELGASVTSLLSVERTARFATTAWDVATAGAEATQRVSDLLQEALASQSAG